ncbi:MAG: DNA damage-inducible protein DinB, partial [Bacteroidetes bacterium]|nr:DNA damage-inducible protein DinB [Bacteroidota bacterium]
METYRKIDKPQSAEYPAYSHVYMDLLQDDGLILRHLHDNFFKIKELIYALPEEKLYYRYAENKWTIKEILVHLVDDERIFSYRALRYARNDSTPLHGFEENDYARYSHANERSLDSI